MFYGHQTWDPLLICSQILAVQALWYLSLGSLLWLLLGPYVSHLTLHHVFDWRLVNVHSFTGWMIIVATLFNALAASAYLMALVERAKKCLDFAATIYIVHAVICWSYSGFPLQLAWWMMMTLAVTMTAALGEWLCLQREMQDIQLGSGIGRRRPGGSTELVTLSEEPSTTSAVKTSFSFAKPGSVSRSPQA